MCVLGGLGESVSALKCRNVFQTLHVAIMSVTCLVLMTLGITLRRNFGKMSCDNGTLS